MNSYFITGTDTDVGKTIITAGLARAISNLKIDVGVMKPFAASDLKNTNLQDTEILAKAARVTDSQDMINPQFFEIPASPFTAAQNLGVKVNLQKVLDSYRKLSDKHQLMLVEGIGGIMTPIFENYFVTNLIKDMNLDTLIITRTKIGTINHTLMTVMICKQFKIPIKGIIINNFDTEGYVSSELKRDLESLTKIPVLGIIPWFENLDSENVANIIQNEIDLQSLLQ